MRRLLPPIIGGLAVLVLLLGLIGTAIRDPHPHDLRVGLVGPAPAVEQISSAFAANAQGAFRFTSYTSEADARAAIGSRDIDAALVIGQPDPHLIVAGAAGDAVTGVITAALTNVFKSQGSTLDVEVVHPFVSGDAHGLVLFFVVVAVIISALVVQALLFTITDDIGFRTRIFVVLAYAVLAGPIAMGTAEWLAGDYGSGLWAAMGLLMVASVAVGTAVAGLVRLLGRVGFGVAALVVVLLDLVSSGGPVGSQLLPDVYRWLAPWMPAGPLYGGLVDVLYFGGAGVGASLLILFEWIAGGIALMLVGELVFTLMHRGSLPPETQP